MMLEFISHYVPQRNSHAEFFSLPTRDPRVYSARS